MAATVRFQFEEPAPLVPRTRATRGAFADALRARRGVWALLGQHATSGAARQDAYEIRRAIRPTNAGFADGVFEAEARTLVGEHRVYVRFVGGGPSAGPAPACGVDLGPGYHCQRVPCHEGDCEPFPVAEDGGGAG